MRPCPSCGVWTADLPCEACEARRQPPPPGGAPPPRPAPTQGWATVTGVVQEVDAPEEVPAPFDGWRATGVVLLAASLLPFGLALVAAELALAAVLAFVGLRRGPAMASGHVALVVFRRLLDLATTERTIARRHLVVRTDEGLVGAARVGPFATGHVAPGHVVQLEGQLVHGTLQVERGFNQTLGARLERPVNGWKVFVLTWAAFALASALAATVAGAS